MIPIVDILKDVVVNIDKVVKIDSIEDLGNDTYKILTCDTKWASICKQVVIDVNLYEIIEVEKDEYITAKPVLSGSNPTGETQLTLEKLNYFHGTPYAVASELVRIQDETERMPLIWLYEVIRENREPKSSRELIRRTANLRIFLMNSHLSDWKTSEHYDYAIEQMSDLADSLINDIDNNGNFASPQSYEIIPRAKFGELVNNGNNNIILNDNLSGVELNFNLRVKKGAYDKKCCVKC